MENGKLIIVKKSDQRVMTFDEVFEQYKELVSKKTKSWSNSYEYDDVYQTVSLGLWKAYRDYDSNKGLAFITAAYRYIDNELLAFHGKHKPKFRQQSSRIRSISSLNVLIKNKGVEGDELISFISNNEVFTEGLMDQLMIEKIFKHISEEQQQDIIKHLEGFTYGEIGSVRNVSGVTIGKRLRASFAKLRTLYKQELGHGGLVS